MYLRAASVLALLFVPLLASAELLKAGSQINTVSSAMEGAGYVKTGLSMEANPGNDLQFWAVDEGVLIVMYSIENQEVVDLSFWLSDERAKAYRKTFDIPVVSFDTKTGIMTLQMNRKQNGEQAESLKP